MMSNSRSDVFMSSTTSTTTTTTTTTTYMAPDLAVAPERFGALRSSAKPRNAAPAARGGLKSDKDTITMGVPATIVPAEVASHFPEASTYFPSTLKKTTPVPIAEEERTRFDALHARRVSLAPYDRHRHADAEGRHKDLLRGTMRDAKKNDAARKARAQAARDRHDDATSRSADASAVFHNEADARRNAMLADRVAAIQERGARHDEFVRANGGLKNRGGLNTHAIPCEIVPAENADGFAANKRYFRAPGLDGYNKNRNTLPLAEEEKIRFGPVAARREQLARHDRDRAAKADARRMAATKDRQAALREKDAQRARKAAAADPAVRAANKGRAITNDAEYPAAGSKSRSLAPEARGFLVTERVPSKVQVRAVEEHFPNAARAMAEFGGPNPHLGKTLPIAEEERVRFDRVPARRAGIAKRDARLHDRAAENRDEQKEARRAELLDDDRRREDAHRRVRDRIAETDRLSKQRMSTAEERRAAILAARVAALRNGADERAARGKHALEERRMVEKGFVPAYSSLTAVAVRNPATDASGAARPNLLTASSSHPPAAASSAAPAPVASISEQPLPRASSSAAPVFDASRGEPAPVPAPILAEHEANKAAASAPAAPAPEHQQRSLDKKAADQQQPDRSVDLRSAPVAEEPREKKARAGCFSCSS